jgi:uncharacterized membrane protein YhhN
MELRENMMIILCFTGVAVQGFYILSEIRQSMLAAVFLKGIASATFVAVGWLGLCITGGGTLPRLILCGLILGALGDVLLNARYFAGKRESALFVAGVVSFFLGHIMYLIVLMSISQSHVPVIVSAAVIAAVIICVMQRTVTASVPMKILGGVYVATVVLMAVAAVGNALAVQNTGRVLYAVGAVLFLCSDIILIFNTFGERTKMLWSAICLALYYPGQLLIALTLYFGL